MQWGEGPSAQGEATRVYIHAGDSNVLERGRQEKGHLGGNVAEQVRVLLAALQFKGGIIQHLFVAVASLLHFQLMDLGPQPHQLPCQLVVQGLHLPQFHPKPFKGHTNGGESTNRLQGFLGLIIFSYCLFTLLLQVGLQSSSLQPISPGGTLHMGLPLQDTLPPLTMEFAELIKTTKVDEVVLSCPGLQTIQGTLAITSHHLLFSSQTEGNREQRRTELWLLIRNVDAIEKRLANQSGTITLKCKDLKILQLEIPGMEECLNIANSIEALSSLESVMMTYPFFYRPQNTTLGTGWLTHITEQYYKQIATDTGAWRLSSINADFGVCPSYPPLVIVPARLDDGTLQKSARFRQGRRFPVLSYYHKKNGTAMLRSSQPLVGPNRKRCHEDELLLTTVLEGGERGFILDTRSLQAAKQARVMGGGLEHRSCYHGWKRLHRALERGRSLQESFIKLVEACNDPSAHMDRWLSRLEASKWLSHVKEALNAACLAAQCLEREEACVLVHGAEGKDTTLLVTALAQVILDPACRTLAGFQGLLEREWIQAGHPFQLRCAHSAYAHARLKQEAPMFLLFLDCIWQLGRQFPFSLAFNEHLLLALFEHCYASPCGTFLGNNEKERRLCEIREKTHCLWPCINHVEKYLNPLYVYNPLVIWPSVEPQSLMLWQGLFLRWVRSSHHLDEAWAEIQQIVTNSQTCSQ